MTLRVTIEIVPNGNEEAKRLIRRFDISNQGPKSTPGFYQYKVIEITEDSGYEWEGYMTHHRGDGAEALALRVLAEFGGKC